MLTLLLENQWQPTLTLLIPPSNSWPWEKSFLRHLLACKRIWRTPNHIKITHSFAALKRRQYKQFRVIWGFVLGTLHFQCRLCPSRIWDWTTPLQPAHLEHDPLPYRISVWTPFPSSTGWHTTSESRPKTCLTYCTWWRFARKWCERWRENNKPNHGWKVTRKVTQKVKWKWRERLIRQANGWLG